MGAFAKGEVVLIDFPFSDGSGSKIRPALIVRIFREDVILVPITTNLYRTFFSVSLADDDFSTGALRGPSLVRTDFLITFHISLLLRQIGRITESKYDEVIDALCAMLRSA